MNPADIIRLTADQEISRGKAMELLRPHLLYWRVGTPAVSGMYIVELEDGEHIVTPYAKPGTEGVDTWGDKRGTGWHCIPGVKVRAWAKVPKCNIGR